MVAPDRDGPEGRNQLFVGNRLRRVHRLALAVARLDTMIASTMSRTCRRIRFTRMDTGQSPQAWVSRLFDEALRIRSDGCDEAGCRGFGTMRESPMPVKPCRGFGIMRESPIRQAVFVFVEKLANLGNPYKFA